MNKLPTPEDFKSIVDNFRASEEFAAFPEQEKAKLDQLFSETITKLRSRTEKRKGLQRQLIEDQTAADVAAIRPDISQAEILREMNERGEISDPEYYFTRAASNIVGAPVRAATSILSTVPALAGFGLRAVGAEETGERVSQFGRDMQSSVESYLPDTARGSDLDAEGVIARVPQVASDLYAGIKTFGAAGKAGKAIGAGAIAGKTAYTTARAIPNISDMIEATTGEFKPGRAALFGGAQGVIMAAAFGRLAKVGVPASEAKVRVMEMVKDGTINQFAFAGKTAIADGLAYAGTLGAAETINTMIQQAGLGENVQLGEALEQGAMSGLVAFFMGAAGGAVRGVNLVKQANAVWNQTLRAENVKSSTRKIVADALRGVKDKGDNAAILSALKKAEGKITDEYGKTLVRQLSRRLAGSDITGATEIQPDRLKIGATPEAEAMGRGVLAAGEQMRGQVSQPTSLSLADTLSGRGQLTAPSYARPRPTDMTPVPPTQIDLPAATDVQDREIQRAVELPVQKQKLKDLKLKLDRGIENLKEAETQRKIAKSLEEAKAVDYNRASSIYEYAINPADEQSGREAMQAFEQYPVELRKMVVKDYAEANPEAGVRLTAVPGTWNAKKQAAKELVRTQKQEKRATRKTAKQERLQVMESQAKEEFAKLQELRKAQASESEIAAQRKKLSEMKTRLRQAKPIDLPENITPWTGAIKPLENKPATAMTKSDRELITGEIEKLETRRERLAEKDTPAAEREAAKVDRKLEILIPKMEQIEDVKPAAPTEEVVTYSQQLTKVEDLQRKIDTVPDVRAKIEGQRDSGAISEKEYQDAIADLDDSLDANSAKLKEAKAVLKGLAEEKKIKDKELKARAGKEKTTEIKISDKKSILVSIEPDGKISSHNTLTDRKAYLDESGSFSSRGEVKITDPADQAKIKALAVEIEKADNEGADYRKVVKPLQDKMAKELAALAQKPAEQAGRGAFEKTSAYEAPDGAEIFPIHDHYHKDVLLEVKNEMKRLGAPTIRVIDMGDNEYVAVEGTHRLRAAKELGLTPKIIELDYDAIKNLDVMNPALKMDMDNPGMTIAQLMEDYARRKSFVFDKSDSPSKKVSVEPTKAEAAKADVPTPVSELERLGLIREWGDRWQYKFEIGGKWFYANSKEGAIEQAQKTFAQTPESERLTQEQRGEIADAEKLADLQQRYKNFTKADLQKKLLSIDSEIASLRKAGAREFTGTGGRRTSAAVSNEAARELGQEKLNIQRFIESMPDTAPAKAFDAMKEPTYKRIVKRIGEAKEAGIKPYVLIKRKLDGGRFVYEAYSPQGELITDSTSISGKGSVSDKLFNRKDRYEDVAGFYLELEKTEPFSMDILRNKALEFDKQTQADIAAADEREMAGIGMAVVSPISELPKPTLSEKELSRLAQSSDNMGYTLSIKEKKEIMSDALNELRKKGISHIDAYHITAGDLNDIKEDGLFGSEVDYIGGTSGDLRESSVYLFLDSDDVQKGQDLLQTEETGNPVVHIKIPISELFRLNWDSNFNLSAGTYSAERFVGDIPGEWIKGFYSSKQDAGEESFVSRAAQYKVEPFQGGFRVLDPEGRQYSFHTSKTAADSKAESLNTGEAKPVAATPISKPTTGITITAENAELMRNASKLKSSGESLLKKAQEDMGRDRQTNTARRARMAAGAEADAAAREAMAKTMLNIADAMERGEVKYLKNVKARTDIQMFDNLMRDAKSKYVTKNDIDYGRSLDLEISEKVIREGAIFERPKPYGEWFRMAANDLEELPDMKLAAKYLSNIADRNRNRNFSMSDDQIQKVLDIQARLGKKKIKAPYQLERILDEIKTFQKLREAGVQTSSDLADALIEYKGFMEGKKAQDPLKAAERALTGRKFEGFDFFPTPPALAERMAKELDVKPGMVVLEPSAGKGDLIDAVKVAQPDANIQAVEPLSDLQEILKLKGHAVIGSDFDVMTDDQQYDRIIMNPPFSKNRDIKHVRKAYDLLKPGGKMVAIMGNHFTFANDKESVEFREWLEAVGGESEALGQAFMGKDAFRQTGVSSQLVTIEKPAASIAVGKADPAKRTLDDIQADIKRLEAMKRKEDAKIIPGPIKLERIASFNKRLDPLYNELEAMKAEITKTTEDNRKGMEPYKNATILRQSEMQGWSFRAKIDGKYLMTTPGREMRLTQNAPSAQVFVNREEAEAAVDTWNEVQDWRQKKALESKADAPAKTPAVEKEKPAARPAATERTKPSEKIEDFGEVLHGAKKHLAIQYKTDIEKAQTTDPANVPLSKSWPAPDYAKMIEEGSDPVAVGLVRALRELLPNKPKTSYKLAKYVTDLEQSRSLSLKILENPEAQQLIKSKIDKAMSLPAEQAFGFVPEAARLSDAEVLALLYSEVGHDKSLKNLRLRVGLYSMLDGVKFDPPVKYWSIEPRGKGGFDVPYELRKNLHGKTAKEAIENFKKVYEQAKTAPKKEKKTELQLFHKREGENSGRVFIGKKIRSSVIELKFFDTVQEAREYRANNYDDLVAQLNEIRNIPFERREVNQPRIGLDRRNGRNITPAEFGETFKLRGVQFGNWVEGTKRQEDLNEAYDSLLDLAEILNVPPEALSLNGELGLAFGARGTGGIHPAKAHYEPDHIVINLTKKAGAGSLAHEWWHALDNYFGKKAGVDYVTDTSAIMNNIRQEMAEAFKAVRQAIMRNTKMPQRAKSLDKLRSKDYWGDMPEMTARAFESYLVDFMNNKKVSNDYLVNIADHQTWEAARQLGLEESDYPYVMPDEMPAVKKAYDNLFKTIKHRASDKGVELYSVEHLAAKYGAKAARSAWDLFKRGATTFAEWAKKMVSRFGKSIHKNLRSLFSEVSKAFTLGKRGAVGISPRPTRKSPTLKQVIRASTEASYPKIPPAYNEGQALKISMGKQQKLSREVFFKGVRKGAADAKQMIKDKANDIAFNRDVLKRFMQYSIPAPDRGNLPEMIAKASTPAVFDKLADRIVDRAEAKYRTRELDRFKKLYKETQKTHSVIGKDRAELLGRLTPEQMDGIMSGKFASSDMAMLRKTVKDMAKNFKLLMQSDLNIPETIWQGVEALADMTPKERLTPAELEKINDGLQYLNIAQKFINTVTIKGQKIEASEAGKMLRQEMPGKKQTGRETTRVGFFKEFIKPVTAVQSLDGPNFAEALGKTGRALFYENMDQGQDKMFSVLASGYKAYDAVVKKLGGEDYAKSLVEPVMTVITTGGDKYELVKSEILSIAAMAEDPMTGALLSTAGFTLGEKKDSDKFLLTQDQIESIYDSLSDDDMEYIKTIKEIFHSMAAETNRTNEALDGYSIIDLANKLYFPRSREISERTFQGDKVDDKLDSYEELRTTAEFMSFRKGRVQTKQIPFRVVPIDKVFERHLIESSLFIGMAEPLRTASRVLGLPGMKREIIGSMGEEYHNRLRSRLSLIAKQHTHDTALDKLLQDGLRRVLPLKLTPRSWLKQVSSIPAATTVIPHKYIRRVALEYLMREEGFGHRPNYDRMVENSPLAYLRYRNNAHGIFLPGVFSIADQQNIFRKTGKVREALLDMASKADGFSLEVIYRAAELWAEETNQPIEWAVKMFEKAVKETQNTMDIVHATGFQEMARKSLPAAMVSAYRSQPTKLTQNMYREYKRWRNKEKPFASFLRSFLNVILANSAINTAVTLGVAVALGRKIERKTVTDQLTDDLLSSVITNPIADRLLSAGDIARAVRGDRTFRREWLLLQDAANVTAMVPEIISSVISAAKEKDVEALEKMFESRRFQDGLDSSIQLGLQFPTWPAKFLIEAIKNRQPEVKKEIKKRTPKNKSADRLFGGSRKTPPRVPSRLGL